MASGDSQIVGIFPIGETGEQFTVAEWVPDPKKIEAELFAMANAFENWAEPLAESREAFRYSTELHFETQSDPYGRPWIALAPQTLFYKRAHGYPEDEILVREGDLKRAATSEEAW